MWPFSKKWKPPEPKLAMLVSISNPELPSLISLANPSGADGAVVGMAGPVNEKPTPENMMGPMQDGGRYVAISGSGGACGLDVDRADPESDGLSVEPAMLEASGLTEEMLAKFNRPTWRVNVELAEPGKDAKGTVIFATRLAQRLATLGDGIVMDTTAFRFFGPTGWAVDDPLPEFDAREHVHVHNVAEDGWFHTHGLIKFGRPELEIYGVPDELAVVAYTTLLDIAQYVITSEALIEPGQTCGDPAQPFAVVEGTKNRDDHWHEIAALELVDLDERQKPVSSGAPKALRSSMESQGGEG